MDERLQQTIEETEKTWGLEAYRLQHHSIFIEKNIVSGHAYILEMEWVLNHSEEYEHPKDSILLEVNLDTKKLCRLFIKGKNHLSKSLPAAGDTEAIIEWIEEKTGLDYGRQFKRTIEQNNELYFHAAVDNVPVFPTGSIHVRFNTEGDLSLFSIDGHFPVEEEIHWEPFDLTTDEMEKAAKQQLRIIELPVESEEKWISAYYIPVHYVSNDGNKVILEEDLEKPVHYEVIDELLEWEEADEEPFIKQEIELSTEVSAEQAFEHREPVDVPLTAEEKKRTKETATRFMQQVFPTDSGDWKLTAAWPNFGYIFAEIKRKEYDAKLIERKIKLIIDRDSMEALNFTNNDQLLEVIRHFNPAAKPTISKEEAFDKLKTELDIIPVYIYDRNEKKYHLSGRAACPYGIETTSGKIIPLQQNQG